MQDSAKRIRYCVAHSHFKEWRGGSERIVDESICDIAGASHFRRQEVGGAENDETERGDDYEVRELEGHCAKSVHSVHMREQIDTWAQRDGDKPTYY